MQRSQEQKGPPVIFSTVRPLRRLSRPAAPNPTLHDMPNQTVITREGNRLNSAKILGPPFLYDPFEFGITFLFRFQGTILPLVLVSPLFWFLEAAHALMLYTYHSLGGEEPLLDWKASVVPCSLLTFLIVTYTSQSYNRYFQLHQHCILMHGCVMDWAALLKLEFGHRDMEFQWNLLRLILGALQVHSCRLRCLCQWERAAWEVAPQEELTAWMSTTTRARHCCPIPAKLQSRPSAWGGQASMRAVAPPFCSTPFDQRTRAATRACPQWSAPPQAVEIRSVQD